MSATWRIVLVVVGTPAIYLAAVVTMARTPFPWSILWAVPFACIAGYAAQYLIDPPRFVARRRRLGFCERCGYDLRASPHRCPECGTLRGYR